MIPSKYKSCFSALVASIAICGAVFPVHAQDVGIDTKSDPIFSKDGKRLSMKGQRNGQDSVWIVDVETAEVTDRLGANVFGTDMKLLRAGLALNRNATYHMFARHRTIEKGRSSDKEVEYSAIGRDDSVLGIGVLPRPMVPYLTDASTYSIMSPKRVLLGRREKGDVYTLYDMLKLKDGRPQKIFSADGDLNSSSFYWVVISPDGRYAFLPTVFVMLDIDKGKIAWRYPTEMRDFTMPSPFSAAGDTICFPLNGDRQFVVRDVEQDKTLYTISLPEIPEATAQGLKPFLPIALPDMKHILVRYHRPEAKSLDIRMWYLVASDGSYKRINF